MSSTPSPTRIHRLKEARKRTGVSLRTVSRRTGLSLRTIRQHEESDDVSLHDLLRWRDALGVPVAELLGDPPDSLSDLRRLRAGLLQIMRGVRSLLQTDLSQSQNAFVRNIESKLQTLMPELEDVRSWPIYGDRRGADSQSRVESQMIATSVWFPDAPQEL